MRMMKRAAVGILAAAMALSMLTACGGSSGGASSSGSSSTGTGSSSSSSSSSGTNSGSSSSSSSSSGSTSTKGDTTKLPDGTEITYQTSKARQYNMARINSSSWYAKMERTYVNNPSMNSIQEEASTGNKRYIKATYPNRNNGKSYEYFYEGDTSYTLYPDLKIAMNYVTINSSTSSTTSETYLLDSIKKTTRVENKVPYYTEVLNYKSKTSGKTMSNIYCFDNSGKLAYIINNEGAQNECVIHYLSYGPTIPNTAILSIPESWEIYTVTYDESAKNSTVTDKSGRTLSNEDVTALYRKINSRS